jgi:lipoprotein-releasing system permease protein
MTEPDAAIAPAAARPFSTFERMVAWRYLRSRRKEAFISVIAGFSFVGIMLGVATLIIVMAVMNGFRGELITRILGINGHMVVQPIDRPLDDYAALATRFKAVDGVLNAIPLVEGQTLASGVGGAGTGALVRGIRAEDLQSMKIVSDNIRSGDLVGFTAGEGVLVGSRMAQSLGLGAGDMITLVAPEGDVTPFGVNPRVKAYPISGIFEVGMSEYDASIIYMPLEEAQLYFNAEGMVQSIELFVDKPDDIDSLRPLVEAAAERQVFITDWRQRNQTFFSALQVERNVMFMILTLIILVAALNIVSGLIMLVKDKGRDIAILQHHGGDVGIGDADLLHDRGGDRCDRNHRRISSRRGGVSQCREHPPVLLVAFGNHAVQPGTLFPQPVARRHGFGRNHHRAGGGAGSVLHRDPDPVLAGLQARSGSGAAL